MLGISTNLQAAQNTKTQQVTQPQTKSSEKKPVPAWFKWAMGAYGVLAAGAALFLIGSDLARIKENEENYKKEAAKLNDRLQYLTNLLASSEYWKTNRENIIKKVKKDSDNFIRNEDRYVLWGKWQKASSDLERDAIISNQYPGFQAKYYGHVINNLLTIILTSEDQVLKTQARELKKTWKEQDKQAAISSI